MLVVFGTRALWRSVDGGAGTARRMPASSRSRSAASARPSSAILPAAIRAATPMPTIPATFSVPARRLRSWRATRQQRQHAEPASNPERANTLRSVELVRRHRQHVDAERLDVHRDLASRLNGIGVKQRAAVVRDARASSAIGWIVPISLLACITETRAVSSASASRSIAAETIPV